MKLVQTGTLERIYYSPTARGKMIQADHVDIMANCGIVDDRYASGHGSYSPQGNPARCVSVMNSDLLKKLGWQPRWTRRNLFIQSIKGKESMDLAFALDMKDVASVHIRIGDVKFTVERYCTPCRVPDAMRCQSESSWSGESFQDAFAGNGGILITPINDGKIHVGDPFYQLPRGH